jgi:glycosyltransferase involved in cell wall biosynthesis
MRVAIDATPLTLSSGGLARYTAELTGALSAQFPEDAFDLVSPMGQPLWWLWGVQREMDRLQAEVFHGTNFEVPYLPVRPSVMSLHDLSPWMDRGWHHAAGRVRRRAPALIKLGIATMIVTDSEAVRRQAIEHFRIHSDRIVAVPLAASAKFHLTGQANRLSYQQPYFLYVGTLEPRKNIPFLVEAWRPVWKQHRIELVLAGRRREDFPALPDEAGLRILGEAADDDLPALYSRALAFVYPSLYEGFGLPVLEAMQCGAYVITSNDPAIAEVIGDAGPRLDPRDPRPWTEALLACARGGALGGERLERWRAQSLARARDFSWERTARLTRQVYIEAQRRFHV